MYYIFIHGSGINGRGMSMVDIDATVLCLSVLNRRLSRPLGNAYRHEWHPTSHRYAAWMRYVTRLGH